MPNLDHQTPEEIEAAKKKARGQARKDAKKAAAAKKAKAAADKKKGEKATQEVSKQGSISDLLFATLAEIAGWDRKSIIIERLPDDLYDRLSELVQGFQQENEAAKAELTEFFKNIVGTTASDDGGDVGDVKGSNTSETVWKVGVAMHMSLKALQAAMITGFVETGDFSNPSGGDRDSVGWRQERASIYGGSTDVNASAKRYFNEIKGVLKGGNPHGSGTYDDSWNPGKLAQAVQGSGTPGIYEDSSGTKYKKGISLAKKYEEKFPINGGKGGFGKYVSSIVSDVADEISGSTKSDSASDPRRDRGKGAGESASEGSKTSSDNSYKKLLKSVDNKNAPGKHGLEGAKKGYIAIMNLGLSFGANNFSGTDGGKGHTAGSDHYTGDALDIAVLGKNTGTIPELEKIFPVIHRLMSICHQVIFKHNIWTNGKKAPYPSDDHLNHIHVSLKPAYANSPEKTAKAVVKALNGETLGDTGDDDSDSGDSGGGEGDNAGATALGAVMNLGQTMGWTEGRLLTGDRALMNDIPVMPFVQQLCETSLRQFQSLPDGQFYAFYPDYFGEMYHRPAYWAIEDIEILDGKIELTDDALITHMYVVGALAWAPPGADKAESSNVTNVLSTWGVMTIYNAFMSKSIFEGRSMAEDSDDKKGDDPTKDTKPTKNTKPGKHTKPGKSHKPGKTTVDKNKPGSKTKDKSKGKDTKGDGTPMESAAFAATKEGKAELQAFKDKGMGGVFGAGMIENQLEANLFLSRYGARVELNNMPFIFNRYFELFSAYQRFLLAWSRQFATDFTFTFMPELYPGGKVSFPNHGIQMYIESVSHNMSYEDGFTTVAVLSAPSVYRTGDSKKQETQINEDLPPNMAKAIVAPIAMKK